MIMDKISNSQDETGALYNVENFILNKLLAQHATADGPLINFSELTDSIDRTNVPIIRSSHRGFDCSKPCTL